MHSAAKHQRRDGIIPKAIASTSAAHPGPTPTPPTQENQYDLWRLSHRALRGRYRLALMIAAGGGIAGATAGALYGQRLYRATGLVRIASTLPPVLRETDQNRPIAMFDGFMQAQREVMTSREMIQTAMREPSWQQVAFGGVGFSDERFAANLKVETRPRSDHLKVMFTHPDPAISAAAVQAIVNSYTQAYKREQDRVEGQRVAELTNRRDALTAELRKLEDDVGEIAVGQDVADLEPLYIAVGDRVRKLRSALADAQCAMAGMTDELQRQPVAVRTPAEVAADEVLRVQTLELARLEAQIEDAQGRFGPLHPMMIRLHNSAKSARERVARATLACQAARTERSVGPSPLSLAEREANLRRLTLAAEEELKRLATRRAELVAFNERSAVLRQSLKETESRLDALATEASQGSRLTVVTNGEQPLTALLDNRPKYAAVGGLAGAALPLGLLVLQASVRRRYRYCDEVADDLLEQVPFVCVLPDLDAPAIDLVAMEREAARSIHQLRVRLQPPTPTPTPTDARAYLVTSTAAGEGKSSVALGLALSYAASGVRTLLIDCDPGSRQLTQWFDADDVEGTSEALAGARPAIRRTRSGLHVLPAGLGHAEQAFALAPAAVAALLERLKTQYDVILIDGEPMLTSVVTSVIAPQTDGVILTFARGQEQAQVQRTLKYIELLDAQLACVAFNKADAGDFRESLRESAATRRPVHVHERRFASPYGPLAGAVVSSLKLGGPDALALVPLDPGQPNVAARAAA